MTNSWVAPDACTLPTVEQPLRAAEFDDLFSHHVVRVERAGPTRLSLLLDGPADLADRVRDLAERETACCSFFTFTLTARQDDPLAVGRLRLDVEVPAERGDVLAAVADRADAVRAEMPK